MSPRSAKTLLDLAESIRVRLQQGASYARWEPEERFTFIQEVLTTLSQVPSFRIATTLGRNRNFQEWPMLLRWWLAKGSLSAQPAPRDITNWYEFVAQNFIYRGAWGLGSIIGLLLDEANGGQPIRALEIGDWPRSGLPWIAFWIKELITWGTLDPVAAFLLARGDAVDRSQAESDARGYYDGMLPDTDANDILDPRQIRDWLDSQHPQSQKPVPASTISIKANLEHPASTYLRSRLPVSPLEVDNRLIWIDPAGYEVARSERPTGWPQYSLSFDFELIVAEATIVGEAYLRYA